jgi:FtsH-binding integral membrane protein
MKDTEPFINADEAQISQKEESDIKSLIRKGFIVKVYSLLFVQLAITFGFIALTIEIKAISYFIVTHFILYLIAVIIPFVILIYFICKPEKMRKVPENYILMFIFCISIGYTSARYTIRFSKANVYLSMFLTLIAVVALTIYAYVTRQDFTMLGGLLSVFLLLLIVCLFINIFLRIRILTLILNIFGIILFSFYIIYDTQLIIGKHSFSLSADDYVLAVINLYLDIINMFLFILDLLGNK